MVAGKLAADASLTLEGQKNRGYSSSPETESTIDGLPENSLYLAVENLCSFELNCSLY
jgi:hypothetical protein